MIGLRFRYFPIRINPILLLGENSIDKEFLVQCFLQYISMDDRKCIASMLKSYDAGSENEEDVVGSAFNIQLL